MRSRIAALAALFSIPALPARAQGPNPCPASTVDKQLEDEISAVVRADDGGAFLIGSSGPSFERSSGRDLWVLHVDANDRPTQERLVVATPSARVAGAVKMPQGGFAIALGRSDNNAGTRVQVMRFDRDGKPVVGQSEILDNGGMYDEPKDIAVSADGSRFAVVHSRSNQSFDRSEGCITFVDSAFPVTVQPDINGIATPAAKLGSFCTTGSPKTDFVAVESIGNGRWGVLGTVYENPRNTNGRMRYLVVDERTGFVVDTRIPSSLGREEAVDLVRLGDGSLAAVGSAYSDYSARGWIARVDGNGRVMHSMLVGPSTPVSKTKNDGWTLGAATATGDGGIVLAGTRWSRHAPKHATRGWVVRLDRSFAEVTDTEMSPTDDLRVSGVWLGGDGRVRVAGRNQKAGSADHDGWTAVVPWGSGDICEVVLK